MYKKRLIESGYVHGDGRGSVVFSLPYLREYIRSTNLVEADPVVPVDEWERFPRPTSNNVDGPVQNPEAEEA